MKYAYWVFLWYRLFFIIVFIIFYLPTFQKYVICIKTTTSALLVFINKRIILTNERFDTNKTQHLTLFNTIFIYKELQCIALQCITALSLALLSLRLQCILVLCIILLCIALRGIPDLLGEDPKNRVDVRTCLHTDFIDFLGLFCIFFYGLLFAFRFNYEWLNDA